MEDERPLVQAVGGALARVLFDSLMAQSSSAGALAFAKEEFWSWKERLLAEAVGIEELVRHGNSE